MASEDKPPPAPSSTSLSFSITSKKERRSVPVNVTNAAPKSQAITALTGSTFLGDVDDVEAPTKRVIAPIANTYRGPAGASRSTNGEKNQDGDKEADGARGERENGAGKNHSRDGGKREHEYGLGKKFVPSFVPPTEDVRQVLEGEDRFENVELPVADSGPVTYGLLRRSAPQDDGEAGTSNGGINENGAVGSGGGRGDSSKERGNWGDTRAPMLDPRKLRQEMDARKLKQDLDDLPPEADLDDYERMPVEEIGMALLRGYGWKEGQGVGRNKQKVDAIEYVKRPERLGIGAQPALTLKDTRPLKMGEKRKDKDMVVAPDASGRPRNIKSLDEKLVPRALVAPGVREDKVMCVVGGRHEGLKARVVKLLPKEEGRSDRALVCLHPSDETVEVRCKDLGELASQVDRHAQHSRDAQHSKDRDRGEKSDKSTKGRPRQEDDTDYDGRGGHGRDYPSKRHHAGDPTKGSGVDKNASRGREDDRGGSERAKGRGSEQGGASPSYRDNRDAAGHRTQESSGMQENKHMQEDSRMQEKSNRMQESSRKQESSRMQESSRKQESSEEESSSSDDEGHGGGKGSSPGHPSVPGHKLWLASHIRVKVVGEEFKRAKGGRLYLKKGAVVDVQPGGYCLVKVDASGETVRLHQSDLETVVPKKPDSYVVVVAGEHKRQRAKLLSCNQQLAAIQLLGELNIVRLPLDDIAEYVGPTDED